MKKLLTLMFACLMAITLCACSKTDDPKEETIGLANPMVEYASLEEINEKVGVHLIHPGVMGVSDEKFFVINDKIAEYDFNVAGGKYCFRAAADTSEDISGVHFSEGTMFEDSDTKVTFYSDDTYNGFRCLLDNGHQYTLVTTDGSVDNQTFTEVANEMYDLICGEESDPEALKLLGDYQDSTSQRASANVQVMGLNTLLIDINWASSAEENDEWVIAGKYENGKLTYGNDEIAHLKYVGEDVSQVNDSVEGYFEVVDGKLLWTGASADNLKACVFEKIEIAN